MSANTIRRLGVVLAAFGVTIAAVAYGFGSTAHADTGDPATFISNLEEYGVITPFQTATALSIGGKVCDGLAAGTPVDSLDSAIQERGYSHGDARQFILTAAHHLCPAMLPAFQAQMRAARGVW